jgi:glutamate N-acetyltransferase/amino-acid N-acetyltransferase
MVTIDGDTSPSDTVVILANGSAGTAIINKGNGELFQKALDEVCTYLTRCIARDGEGATKLIEVLVEGALSEAQARMAARTIAGSSLFKAAMYGNDPNWGRIVAALGRSGAKVNEKKLEVYLNGVCVMKQGSPIHYNEKEMRKSLAGKEVSVKLCLNLARGKAVAWGCDLSEEYVTINSAYTS